MRSIGIGATYVQTFLQSMGVYVTGGYKEANGLKHHDTQRRLSPLPRAPIANDKREASKKKSNPVLSILNPAFLAFYILHHMHLADRLILLI